MQRAIRLKLTPTVAQASTLAETSRQFTAVFNAVCAVGWTEQITNGVKLHHATYYPLKADYPALVSDLLIQARVKATEAVKSALALQKKGTKSAKRHLKRVRGKQARFRRNNDHILSKRIVGTAERGATIVLENLTDIRKRSKVKRKTEASRRVHSWSFAQLKSFIEYKAEERGCRVVAVDPRHTSQACSCCGHTVRSNRRSRGRFECRACGFELHADLNAARNIAAKYHASVAIRDAGGLTVNQPIASSPLRSG